MKDYQIIDEHLIIRETIGYEKLNQIEIHDLPNVLKFLRIVSNYTKMVKINTT